MVLIASQGARGKSVQVRCVELVAPIGADAVAEWLLASLQAEGIDVSAVARNMRPSSRPLRWSSSRACARCSSVPA